MTDYSAPKKDFENCGNYSLLSNYLVTAKELSAADCRVYWFLASRWKGCSIGISQIAKEIFLSRGTVLTSLKNLESIGLITRRKQANCPSDYILNSVEEVFNNRKMEQASNEQNHLVGNPEEVQNLDSSYKINTKTATMALSLSNEMWKIEIKIGE